MKPIYSLFFGIAYMQLTWVGYIEPFGWIYCREFSVSTCVVTNLPSTGREYTSQCQNQTEQPSSDDRQVTLHKWYIYPNTEHSIPHKVGKRFSRAFFGVLRQFLLTKVMSMHIMYILNWHWSSHTIDPVPTKESWDHFYQYGLTLISTRISNYIHYKMWDEITYPFLNHSGGATVEV